MIVTKKEFESFKTTTYEAFRLLERDFDKLEIELNELKKQKELPLDLKGRIEDIELWRSKMHTLLTEKTPAGKEKINRNFKFLRGQI